MREGLWAAFVVAVMVVVAGTADAGPRRRAERATAEVQQDRHEIQRDRRDLRESRRKLREDRRELRQDRRALRLERRDARQRHAS